jgi:hypothetical protein
MAVTEANPRDYVIRTYYVDPVTGTAMVEYCLRMMLIHSK